MKFFPSGPCLCLALGCATLLHAARAKPTAPAGTAANGAYKGAIVMDAGTGRVLFEDQADVVSPPASMTKLMTYAVLADRINAGALTPATPVTVTAEDSRIGGTQVWLKEKEVFPVEELIYAMMIQSANDAAFALARTALGSVPAFVEAMNAKARELGMTHTTFRSPHGLPPDRKVANGDLTTPRDFALLSRYDILHTGVLKYTSVPAREFGPPVRAKAVRMDTHNHLLGHVAGVDGLKTGYTVGAGYCLAATAERQGRRIIVVVMGSPSIAVRDRKVIELLERGFALVPPVAAPGAAAQAAPAPAGSPIVPAPAAPGAPGTPPPIRFALPSR